MIDLIKDFEEKKGALYRFEITDLDGQKYIELSADPDEEKRERFVESLQALAEAFRKAYYDLGEKFFLQKLLGVLPLMSEEGRNTLKENIIELEVKLDGAEVDK